LKLSRQEEVDYLSKMEYTILGKSTIFIKRTLGNSVGGKETLTSNQPFLVKHPSQLQEEKKK
jgi:CRISPR/Cas system CMR-associated protein Cmr3 (group 5 of RAMP superfamily)